MAKARDDHLVAEAQRLRGAIEQEEAEKNTTRESEPDLEPDQKRVYREALIALNKSGRMYAVGAAFARHVYTNIWRPTKDLDVFVKPEDLCEVFAALQAAGFETQVKDGHWLGKAWKEKSFIDLIFGTGHGHLPINDEAFAGCRDAEVLGVPTHLIPIEEMISSAAYIAGRNRFDGGEIAHLIRSTKGNLDWERILRRLSDNRELLLWHLTFFDFIYPGHAHYLPHELMEELFAEAKERWHSQKRSSRKFRGTLLDPFSYNVDVEDWGYEDSRIMEPIVNEKGELL